jgi:short-subunit dehydrogenase
MERRTALVTGASSGFGAEFCRRFAQDGFDVAMVARRGVVMEELAQELEERHGIATYVLPKDLAHPSASREIAENLAGRGVQVDALVNSAGFALFGPFTDEDEQELSDIVMVNILAMTELSRLIAPGMVERGWGRIVNLSSVAAFVPGPLMAAYYASKAYVLSLSIAMSVELEGTGVTVTALCPGPVRTGFQARARMEDSRLATGKMPTVVEVADFGYDAMNRGKSFAVHGARNKFFVFGSRLRPRPLAARIARKAQERLPH